MVYCVSLRPRGPLEGLRGFFLRSLSATMTLTPTASPSPTSTVTWTPTPPSVTADTAWANNEVAQDKFVGVAIAAAGAVWIIWFIVIARLGLSNEAFSTLGTRTGETRGGPIALRRRP